MKQQSGYSLIEIMIALLVGLIVTAATINIYISTVSSSTSTLRTSRLNHDMEAVMTLMINDIKRAGYWGSAKLDSDSRNNLFTAATTNIQIPASTCITYTYDDDNDGVVDAGEYFGFKQDGDTIKVRESGTTTADCGAGAGSWEEFIDGNQLIITQLDFSFVPVSGNSDADLSDPEDLLATSRCWNGTTNTAYNAATCTTPASGDNVGEKRVVNIRLTGRLRRDATVTKTINGTVEVRNKRVRLIP